jgi:hypothetical protein
MKRTSKLLIVLVLATAMTACTGTTEKDLEPMETFDSARTPQEGKAQSLEMQDELVGLIPSDWIAARSTEQVSHVRKCGPSDAYSWMGLTSLTFTSPRDTDDLVESIAEHYKDSRFTVSIDKNPSGYRRVDLAGVDGEGYLIAPASKDLTKLTIDAWSPCFLLPEGMSALDTF